MREIKFRAWDKDNHNMWYSDKDEDGGEGPIIWNLNSIDGVSFSEPQLINRCPGGKYHEQSIEYIEPNQTIMEYTGLKDSEGNEIYEGDIVEFIYGISPKVKGVVYYRNSRGGFYLNVIEGAYEDVGMMEERSCKVIGNIFENPELLEGDK